MLKNILFKFFVFSGIIPASILLLLGLSVCFMSFEDLIFNLKGIFISLCYILAMIGYIGLWRVLISQNSKKQKVTMICLFLGMIGYIFFFIFEGGQRAWNWFIEFKEPFEILLFFWPIIVTLFCLSNFLLNKKYSR